MFCWSFAIFLCHYFFDVIEKYMIIKLDESGFKIGNKVKLISSQMVLEEYKQSSKLMS